MVSAMWIGMCSGSILLMGVAGSGKSSVGPVLAAALGVHYIEGDDFHSIENRKKMAAGTSLNDQDRKLWLERLSEELRLAREQEEWVVLGCSALKQQYRQQLRAGDPKLRTVWLDVPKEVLERRIHT